ncbi:hypothetical protein ACH4UT_27885 [Streptomyces sp. NPDC020799]|uniref:hypothetical protein n=1 Tax=Streptomyces sp. NPDC020799 TaxID=3365091 RepID=UPI00379B830B
MGIFSRQSDDDLAQSLELASECAQEARKNGDRSREAAFHKDINEALDEVESRGWFRR